MFGKSQMCLLNLIIIFSLLLVLKTIDSSGYATNNVVHTLAEGTHGTWKKKWTWKQRWVKNWKPKTVYVAHWTRVWTPAEINEYVPLPSIPQNWVKPTEHC